MQKQLLIISAILGISSAGLAAQSQVASASWLAEQMDRFLQGGTIMALGWSDKGTVALVTSAYTGGMGGTLIRLLMVDTVSDHMLFDQTLWDGDFAVPYDETERLAQAMAGSSEAVDFVILMNQRNVRPIDGIDEGGYVPLFEFPHFTRTSSYIADVRIVDETESDMWPNARNLDFQVVVEAPGGYKIIVEDSAATVYSIEVRGYLQSPFEDRIAVIYSVNQVGFEGDANQITNVAGCHLTAGRWIPYEGR